MRTTPTYKTLQRLAQTDLALAIELGAAIARREQAEALREAFRDAGAGLAQMFGLAHRSTSHAHRHPHPSRS
ncbi:MAG TPA: hypothetical protein VJL84_09890 [Kiloniellales bacterium]|nr:hypothetical protein [Kiloniellales bacterium]